MALATIQTATILAARTYRRCITANPKNGSPNVNFKHSATAPRTKAATLRLRQRAAKKRHKSPNMSGATWRYANAQRNTDVHASAPTIRTRYPGPGPGWTTLANTYAPASSAVHDSTKKSCCATSSGSNASGISGMPEDG